MYVHFIYAFIPPFTRDYVYRYIIQMNMGRAMKSPQTINMAVIFKLIFYQKRFCWVFKIKLQIIIKQCLW